jgi:trehalose 6-phosphate synthase/phosphatase
MKPFSELSYKRLVIIAYRLPFKLVKKGNATIAIQNSGGLVSAILSLSEKMNVSTGNDSKILWIGTGEEQLGKGNINPKFDLLPVEIPDDINEKYYGGFCNDTIWPLFHYFPSLTIYNPVYYKAYDTANQIFADTLRNVIKPGDFIWVHDYQLFHLPLLIRSFFPDSKIGFFLHIPFPSSELFRNLPRLWRESILKGILGADLIGFHTNDYVQHFIKSVKRTLGSEIDNNYIQIDDRICKIDAFPIGIDFDKFHNACSLPKVLKEKERLRNELAGTKLIFSVDRLDYTKGFLHRLQAYELFLENYPKWHQKVVFNMVIVPSRDNIDRYRDLKKEIEATVGRINGKYSTLAWRPLIYQYKSITFEELVALYDISDVGLITPLRDGMNLVAKEYVTCQKENIGMLILSEMAGAAVELTEAIIINPTDVQETAEAIDKALSFPQKEKEQKISKMQHRLSRYNVFTWATDFFNQAEDVTDKQKQMEVNFLNSKALAEIRSTYCQSNKRVIFIDYDGTLIPLSRYPEMAILNENAAVSIKKLLSDDKNKIVIISGRECEFLERQFEGLDVTLVAEHGFYVKKPKKDWVTKTFVNLSWKEKILPILNEYVDRCNGSMIEEKHASLAWHYRNADEEIVSIRINELKDDLKEILKGESKLQVLEGNKVLEIKSILYDKGTAALEFLNKEKFDFIMAIGDDKTDEDLFVVVPHYGFTIKIGDNPSKAKYNLKKQSQIYEILDFLC